jgi:hypothetical protein
MQAGNGVKADRRLVLFFGLKAVWHWETWPGRGMERSIHLAYSSRSSWAMPHPAASPVLQRGVLGGEAERFMAYPLIGQRYTSPAGSRR